MCRLRRLSHRLSPEPEPESEKPVNDPLLSIPASAPSTPPLSLDPRPGQPDAEVLLWFNSKYPTGRTNKSHGAYAAQLYKTRPKNDGDPAGPHWTWCDDLTPLQKEILRYSTYIRQTDPERRAEQKRKADKNPFAIKRREEQRIAYQQKIEAEGKTVRSYRRDGTKPDKETLAAEKKARTNADRQRIRNCLAAGENPFEPGNAKFDLCRILLERGACALDLDDPATKTAFEALRVAKAVSRKGDVVSLHREIKALRDAEQTQSDMDQLRSLPNFGIMA